MYSDDQIRSRIVDQLAEDVRIDASNIRVDVSEGVATLKGTVPSAVALKAVLAGAAVVPGVTRIVDALAVRVPPENETKDSKLKILIMDLLSSDRDIDPSRITVLVQMGAVTLDGSVDVDWKKAYVEQLVAACEDVDEIVSRLTVVPTKAVTDQATAETIHAALEEHALVDANKITVRVKNGKVTLSGRVSGPMARQIVRRAASYALGVTAVHDELRLDSPG